MSERASLGVIDRPIHSPQLRADAAWALYHILELGRSSREVMPLIFSRYEQAKDRAWLQEAVYGVLRVLPTLQVWLRELLDKPLKKQQKIIEHVIMIGLFQQAFMRTSAHAAVSETVNASKLLKHPQLGGMVNAILRNFERSELKQAAIDAPHAKVNLPKWLYKKLSAAYSEQLDSICENMMLKAPLWLRVNLLVVSLDTYSKQLDAHGIEHDVIPPRTVLLKQNADIVSLPLFEEGGFAVQDMAAQQASSLLDVQDGEIVLDACAAPGGKTAAIIEYCDKLGELYAVDSEPNRNERTFENLTRLGHLNRLGDRLKIRNLDISQPDSYHALPLFDKILLDAPCSATGIIRRHPDIKWHRKSADIQVLVTLQRDILCTAWAALKPGGILLYATCSILPEENSGQIRHFLDEHADAELLPIGDDENAQQPGWQILPGQANMDGFFYARLLKSQKGEHA